MRIFLVCADSGIPLDGTKGASVHLRSLAEAFHRLGHEVQLFVENTGSAEIEAPYAVRRLEPVALEEAARSGRPDLVYERYALGHEHGLKWARAMDAPFALEVNAPLVEEASRHRPWSVRPAHADIERRLFRGADLVVAVSEPLRRYVADVRGTADGCVVVRNGCDPSRFAAPIPPSEDRRETVAFLGHPKPWHGAEELPWLIAELKRRGRDTGLLLIGGGEGAVRVTERALVEGVDDRVQVTGPLSPDEAARRLQGATVGVAPYPPHPFFYFCPLKVVEYMAAGLPLVTTAQGDIPAVVGDAGILAPPGDRTALADAVEAVLANEDLAARLGARGRQRALVHFTWERAAREVVRAANDVIAARGRAA